MDVPPLERDRECEFGPMEGERWPCILAWDAWVGKGEDSEGEATAEESCLMLPPF